LPKWRPFSRRHERQQEIGQQQDRLDQDDSDVPAINLRKQHFDRGHRHDRREPHHRAPRRGEPEADRRNEIDHREKDGRRLPGRRLEFEPAARRNDDAGHLRPVEQALDHRQPGHHAQEKYQDAGPAAGLRLLAAMHGIERAQGA
jgi:hypothetical protein